jgi:hypothetical protein
MDAGLVKGEGFAVNASVIKADASQQRGVPGDEEINWRDPSLSTRAVREYLDARDDEALAEALPKRLSLTDPLSRWTAAPGGPAFFAYSTNYLIDVDHGVIMDVEPTPAHRTAEVESTKTMIERVEEHFDIKPRIGSSAIPLMEPHRCWPGWWTKKTSSHMCRYGTKPSVRTTASRSAIFNGMKMCRNILPPRGMPCVASGGPSRTSAHMSRKPTPSSSDPGKPTVLHAQ